MFASSKKNLRWLLDKKLQGILEVLSYDHNYIQLALIIYPVYKVQSEEWFIDYKGPLIPPRLFTSGSNENFAACIIHVE